MRPFGKWRNNGADRVDDCRPEEGVRDRASELDIEKQWLSLTRVDPDQFEYFYRKYRPRIFKYLFHQIRDEDLATNLTDETFSRAVDKLDSFEWRGFTFGAWLFRIARNVMAQDYQRRQARPEVMFDPDLHDRAGDSSPERDLDHADERRLLEQALDSLNAERKEVIVCHYWVGLTTREIAVIVDMAEATVRSHLQRGRKQLQKHLLEHGMERGLAESSRKLIAESMVREDGWRVLGDGGARSPEEHERDAKAGDCDD